MFIHGWIELLNDFNVKMVILRVELSWQLHQIGLPGSYTPKLYIVWREKINKHFAQFFDNPDYEFFFHLMNFFFT